MVTICTASLTFNNSTFCPHNVFMCFVWIWQQTAIISLYSINWLGFIIDLTLYSPVVTICTTSLTFNNSTFCPHTVFLRFVWIISLYNISWLVFITEAYCIYCAVRTDYTLRPPAVYQLYKRSNCAHLLHLQTCHHTNTSEDALFSASRCLFPYLNFTCSGQSRPNAVTWTVLGRSVTDGRTDKRQSHILCFCIDF